jgi:hypothetical protein
MYKQNIGERLNEVISYRQEFDDTIGEDHLNKITAPLVAVENELREQIQSDTSTQIETIIKKLESNSEIDDADLRLIRLWIVGDAESYIERENDYKGWLSELNRLYSVIESIKSEELDLENMYKLSGTVRDAVRVIGDIIFFKQQQERVEKFENASKDLNLKNKITLANILTKKLQSDRI